MILDVLVFDLGLLVEKNEALMLLKLVFDLESTASRPDAAQTTTEMKQSTAEVNQGATSTQASKAVHKL